VSRFLLVILGSLLGPALAAAETISVSAAISLKDALGEIAADYQARTGERVRFSFGSSGQLAAQVTQGAPVDVFVSAAEREVTDLVAANLAAGATRVVVAGNALVLVVPTDAKDPPAALCQLADRKVRRIAIGEPRTVPAGEYAAQVLKSLKLDDAVRGRLVYGSNVRQVLDYVARGEVDAGLVYHTDAAVAGDEVRVVATVDPATHAPIVYPAVVVSASKKKDAANRFLEYLGSAEAQATLAARGFAPPPPPTTAPTTTRALPYGAPPVPSPGTPGEG
jgi:molybdate transport system substrate-binding protein